MKKMQAGGTKTYKGTKGATTIKKESNTSVPNVVTTHKGKKGVTTKTSNDLWKGPDITHQGKKGITTKENNTSISHTSKKGTTQTFKGISTSYSNKKGYTNVVKDKDGSKKVTYISKAKPNTGVFSKTIKPKK
jgi:hypothetical protein